MSDEALRGTSLREVVVETIRDWIVSGVLAPGERLAEAKLARQLEVSRAPVREAIQVLSQQGFVELWPGSSPQVAKPSMRDILEYLDVCVALQRMSSRLAARNRQDDDLAVMAAAQSAGKKAVELGDLGAASRLNEDFHEAIAAAARNRRLSELITLTNIHLDWMIRDVARLRGIGAWDEHDELLAAIVAGDADRAGDLAEAHVQASRDAYIADLTGSNAHGLRPQGR